MIYNDTCRQNFPVQAIQWDGGFILLTNNTAHLLVSKIGLSPIITSAQSKPVDTYWGVMSSYPKIVSLNLLIASNAMNWPGDAANSFYT